MSPRSSNAGQGMEPKICGSSYGESQPLILSYFAEQLSVRSMTVYSVRVPYLPIESHFRAYNAVYRGFAYEQSQI